MTPLFERGGLLQDDGRISERWGQPGSEIFNFVWVGSSDYAVHTVTAGKKFYLSSISYSNYGTLGGNFVLKDGGSGGTPKLDLISEANAVGITEVIVFSVPLVFETDIYYDEINSVNANFSMSGWEE